MRYLAIITDQWNFLPNIWVVYAKPHNHLPDHPAILGELIPLCFFACADDSIYISDLSVHVGSYSGRACRLVAAQHALCLEQHKYT